MNGDIERDHEPYSNIYSTKEGFVVWECGHYDHEDNRIYSDYGKFPIDEFKRALAETVKKGKSKINHDRNVLEMLLEPDTRITLKMRGENCCGSTPGGGLLTSTSQMLCDLSRLQSL